MDCEFAEASMEEVGRAEETVCNEVCISREEDVHHEREVEPHFLQLPSREKRSKAKSPHP